MIKCVIFDFGEVCTRGDSLDNFAVNLAGRTGLPAKAIRETYAKMEYPYEMGMISPERFWQGFRKELGLEMPSEDIQKIHLDIILGAIDYEMLDFVRELKNDFKTVLLTNSYDDLLAVLKKDYGIEKYFNDIFSSSQLHLKKPNRKIYEYVAKELEIAPGEAVFIDDKAKNINGAKTVGFETILYRGLPECKSRLELMIEKKTRLPVKKVNNIIR